MATGTHVSVTSPDRRPPDYRGFPLEHSAPRAGTPSSIQVCGRREVADPMVRLRAYIRRARSASERLAPIGRTSHGMTRRSWSSLIRR
jgi:hypothetical protein